MPYKAINLREIENPVGRIADDWALLSAGTPDDWNTMTVSWGGVGEIWGYDAAFVFVRPQRHSFRYMEKSEYFTLSFGLPKKVTAQCGKASGRDYGNPNGKIGAAGLTTCSEEGAVWPAEADIVLLCRKAAAQTLDPAGFIDPGIEKHYDGDYHRMYVGQIVKAYQREE